MHRDITYPAFRLREPDDRSVEYAVGDQRGAGETDVYIAANPPIDAAALRTWPSHKNRGWIVLYLWPVAGAPETLEYDWRLAQRNRGVFWNAVLEFGVREFYAAWGDISGSHALRRARRDLRAVTDYYGFSMFSWDPETIAHEPNRIQFMGPRLNLPARLWALTTPTLEETL